MRGWVFGGTGYRDDAKLSTELALGHGIIRERDDLYPGLRVRLAGSHNLVYSLTLKLPDYLLADLDPLPHSAIPAH